MNNFTLGLACLFSVPPIGHVMLLYATFCHVKIKILQNILQNINKCKKKNSVVCSVSLEVILILTIRAFSSKPHSVLKVT